MPVNEICALCPSRATENHHIIRRAQMPGSLFEDWSLNKIGLCTRCHAENHGGKPVRNEVFWDAKNYTGRELTILALVATLPPPKSGLSHLSARNWWVAEKHPSAVMTAQAVPDFQKRQYLAGKINDAGIDKVPKWIREVIESGAV